MTANLVEGG